nr:unnamed protein product [Callosobruchus analis]
MYQMYIQECEKKASFFRKVFNRNFNIGFGSPQVDVCSQCLEYKERIKRENNEALKGNLLTKQRIHKLKQKHQITYYKRQLYLNKIEISDKVKEIRLVSDGCTGQNKNTTIIAMCAKWLISAPQHLDKMQIIFPVTGHSFLPADRVFAFIEKDVKKLDTIVVPEPTSSLHFKIKSCKRIILTRSKTGGNHIFVRGEPNYKVDVNNAKGICKTGKQII